MALLNGKKPIFEMAEFPNGIRDPFQQAMSFSTIAASGTQPSSRKQVPVTSELTADDFPALGSPQSSSRSQQQSREEILMSNLLGSSKPAVTKSKASVIGRNIAKPINTQSSMNYAATLSSAVSDEPQSSLTTNVNSLKSDAHSILSGDRFGMFGLVDVVRMTDEDLSMLALGCDLTSLGLNLNQGEPLSASFMTPLTDAPSMAAEPVFSVPQCYSSSHSIAPALCKTDCFSDELLFYIFYAMPRDVLQEAAAQQLYKRGWRFHKDLKLWLCKDTDAKTIATGAGFERSVFTFFDPSSWSRVKKDWILYYDQLEDRKRQGISNLKLNWFYVFYD